MDINLELLSKEKRRALKISLRALDKLQVVICSARHRKHAFTGRTMLEKTMLVWASGHRSQFRWSTYSSDPSFWLGEACFEVTSEEAQKISETFGFPLPKKEQAA